MRYLKPIIVLVVAAAAVLGDRIVASPELFRLGVALVIVGVLWSIAIGFSLNTLRLAAALAVLAIVYLLIGVGADARSEVSANEFESLKQELEIEFNLVRGPLTTRGQVADSLWSSQEIRFRADGVVERLTIATAHLEGWDASLPEDAPSADDEPGGPAAQIAAYRSRVTTATDRLEATGDLAWEAARKSWAALGFKVPPPAEEPIEAGEELADPTARLNADFAEQYADDLASEMTALEPILTELDRYGLTTTPPADGLVSRPPDPFDLARISATNDGERDREDPCSVPERMPSSYEGVAARASLCVSGCAGGSGPCSPRLGKRILLLGFQSRLVALTSREDLAEDEDELTAKLDDVTAQLAELDEPASIHRLAMDGADEILGDAFRIGGSLEADRQARLGGWGWLVITIAVVIGYRFLEVVNDRRSPGPVNVLAGDGKKPSPETELSAELVRAHLAVAELQEPSPLPGGEAVTSIAKSTESAGMENAVVSFLVGLLQTTVFPRRGVDVVVTAQPAAATDRRLGATSTDDSPSEASLPTSDGKKANGHHPRGGGDAPGDTAVATGAGDRASVDPAWRPRKHRLLVRARNNRRGGLLFSHPFEGDDLDKVTFAAAYFTAERLLDSGWTTPSWLVWSSQDGSALSAYQRVMIDEQSPQSLAATSGSGDETAESAPDPRQLLSHAVAASPGTGAALLALSHEAALDGDHAAALHLLLLTRVRHPNFLTARFRLGVTLSAVAEDLASNWPTNADPRRENEIAGARDVLADLDERWTEPELQDVDQRALLLDMAIDELTFVIDSTRLVPTIVRARRQDEREYWLGLARSRRSRRALASAATAARALAQLRRRALDARSPNGGLVAEPADRRIPADIATTCDEVTGNAVGDAPDDWLVRYHAACYRAARARLARELLTADEGPDGGADEGADQAADAGVDRDDAEVEGHRRAALDHLRRARYARNGQQLAREWVEVDPELEPLRRGREGEWARWLDAVFEIAAAPEDSPTEDPDGPAAPVPVGAN